MRITLEQRLRAAGGPTAYMRRLRRIEELQAAFLKELREVYEESLAALENPEVATQKAARHGALLDLAKLNDLIDRHNRYYPVEANLRIDVRTRVVMDGTEPWRPMLPVTLEDLLKQAVHSG